MIGMEKVSDANNEHDLKQDLEDLDKELPEYKQKWLELRMR